MNSTEKIQGFFASDRLLRGSVIVFTPLLIINIIAKYFLGLYTLCISDLCFLLCILFLYRAFCRHDKNVQKGLLGAVLMWYLVDELNFVLSSIVFDPTAFSQYSNFAGIMYLVLSLVTTVLYVVLFINHFVITGDHKSSPGKVKLTLALGIALLVVTIGATVSQCIVLASSAAALIEGITWHIALAAFLMMLGSYEAHFEQWKEQREISA